MMAGRGGGIARSIRRRTAPDAGQYIRLSLPATLFPNERPWYVSSCVRLQRTTCCSGIRKAERICFPCCFASFVSLCVRLQQPRRALFTVALVLSWSVATVTIWPVKLVMTGERWHYCNAQNVIIAATVPLLYLQILLCLLKEKTSSKRFQIQILTRLVFSYLSPIYQL
jgi:hypothetical protein